VGRKMENPWGLYDVLGNVNEWPWDWYATSHPGDREVDPEGPEGGSYRVFRGGSWFSGVSFCRLANRIRRLPDIRYRVVGFRVVRTLPSAL